MSVVSQYSKVGNSTLYDAKVCVRDKCDIIVDQYRFVNGSPSDQIFAFPSTADNKVFMVGERIVQDSKAFQDLVINNAKKQTCFDIDPCDVYTAEYCCSTKQVPSTKGTTPTTPPSQSNDKQYVNQEDSLNDVKTDVTSVELFVFFLVIMVFIVVMAIAFGIVAWNK